MRKLVIIGRLQMQFCAILSQIHRHKDALDQAKEAVKLNHLLINDLTSLCKFYIKREEISAVAPAQAQFHSHSITDIEPRKNRNLSQQSYASEKSVGSRANRNRSFSSFLSQQEAYGGFDSLPAKSKGNLSRVQSTHSLSSFASANQLEASMSYIEKTARKLHPILQEVKKRMIPEKKRRKENTILQEGNESSDDLLIDLTTDRIPAGVSKHQATDMKNILGYLN